MVLGDPSTMREYAASVLLWFGRRLVLRECGPVRDDDDDDDEDEREAAWGFSCGDGLNVHAALSMW